MAEESTNSLDLLPTYEDALKSSKEEYYKAAKGVFEHRKICPSPIAEMYEKFYEWCVALNCVSSIEDCKIPPYPETGILSTPASLISTISNQPRTLVTSSYSQLMNVVGYNGTCYDDYYCNQRSVAPYLHYILGITCLIMCLIGILTTSLFLPVFNVASHRTGVTLYLTAIAIIDCIYMILFTVIVVIQYIPYEYTDQLDMYSRFTANLIPHGLPTLQLMEILSVWITVAVLIDRFLYLKFGFHSKIICSRKASAKIIASILILLLIYTIPKFLEYHVINYPKIGVLRVMYTEVGFNESFQNMLLHWLKVPIEMFLPYLADAIFSVINSIKFYDLMYKRKLSEASKNKRRNAELNPTDENDVKSMMFTEIEKDTVKFPSLTVDSNMPKVITSSLKDAEDKENSMVIVSLILGFLLVALKIPKFILHALKSEQYVNLKSTKFFQPVNDFLDLSWVFLKPIIFICVAKHFRQALKSVFCCTEFDNDTVIKVCPAVKMTEMASLYLQNAPEFSSNTNSHSGGENDHSRFLEDKDEGLFMKTNIDV